jgi:drug/metabolite transporter (DMT)-like permease
MPVLVGLSVVQIFVPNFLQNVGMEYTTAAVSSVLQSTTPVFTLVLAFVFLRERVGWQQIVGVIVAMTGVALLSTGGDLSNLARSQLAGNLMQVAVAASYGFSGLMGKRLLRKYPPLQVVALTFVLGGVLLTAVAIFFERSDWPMSLSFEVIVALVLLSFLYCIGLVSWYSVLKTTGVFRLYVLLFIMPVLAVAISIIVLRENFTMLDVLFSAITLLGVGITEFRMDRWRRSSSTPP